MKLATELRSIAINQISLAQIAEGGCTTWEAVVARVGYILGGQRRYSVVMNVIMAVPSVVLYL